MGFQSYIATLVGAVVAGVITYMIWVFTIQNQERSVAATQHRAVRTSEHDLWRMVERDFTNIGSNHPFYENDPTTAIRVFNITGAAGEFVFVGQTERGMPPDTVRYVWTVNGTKTLKEGETVETLLVERFVNGSIAGYSSGAVTRFEVTMLDNEGLETLDKSAARQIEVGLSMFSTLGENQLIGLSHWDSIIRPTALARLDYENFIDT